MIPENADFCESEGEEPMKKEFSTCPAAIDETKLYGFSWENHVAAIPMPLMVVTSYKENGKANAAMQSWSAFVSEEGYYCIFGSVSKKQHMYETVRRTGQLVINFPSADIYEKCLATIRNNGPADDEIALSGLTAERAGKVNAPRIRECFLNLECEYVWEKEITPGNDHVVMCVRIVNICMEEEYYNEQKKGRYGESGYLYNIHSPRNPESGRREKTCVGVIRRLSGV